jgi:hypothetical protein
MAFVAVEVRAAMAFVAVEVRAEMAFVAADVVLVAMVELLAVEVRAT